MTDDVIDYGTPGVLTTLTDVPAAALAGLPGDPAAICGLARHLVIQPGDALALGLPARRAAEKQVRPAGELVRVLAALDPAPLTAAREPARRVVGTCRHFAVLTCALLRFRGVPARVRCGFATYFQPGLALDHWVTEYRGPGDRGWVRIDPEILGGQVLDHAEDLRPGEFLTGGEAWTAFRSGAADGATFGVHGTSNFGPAEIRGNAVKDLAAMNKVEMLPWDEWGRMTASYQGETGPEYDELIDAISAVCAGDDPAAVAGLYATEDLAVPPEMVRAGSAAGA